MNSKKYYTIVGVCVAAVVIIIAVFGFGVFRSEKPAQTATATPQAVEQTPDAVSAPQAAPAAPPVPKAQTYIVQCDGRKISVTAAMNEPMLIKDEDSVYHLHVTPAASGAKYVTAEGVSPKVTFWGKGRQVVYEVEGQAGQNCEVAAVELPNGETVTLPSIPVAPEAAAETQSTQAAEAPAAETVAAEAAADVADAEVVDAQALSESTTLDPATGEIEGIVWQAIEMNDKPLAADAGITLQLQDGRIAGRSGCNRYTGPYEIDVAARSLKVTGPVAGTRMACPGEAMALEDAFNKLLPTITAYRLDAGNVLVVFAGEEEVLHLSPAAAGQE